MAAEAAALEAEFRGESSPKPGRGGRPRKSTSTRAKAKAGGVDAKTVRNLERHVAVGEEFPAMQAPDWKQSHVLRADECLKAIGAAHRQTFGEMISEPGVPMETALEMLENVAKLPKQDRKRIAELYRSDAPRDRSLAKTRAAKLPPPPPPDLTLIHRIRIDAERLVKIAEPGRRRSANDLLNVSRDFEAIASAAYQKQRAKELG
jgi:hypothetical protein